MTLCDMTMPLLPEILDALLQLGYSDQDVRAITGENWLRIAGQVWQ